MLSTIVHYIFDWSIYRVLLDILSFLHFKQDEFEYTSDKDCPKEILKKKIVFNCTLLAISYVSSLQFTTILSGCFFYWYAFILFIRVL